MSSYDNTDIDIGAILQQIMSHKLAILTTMAIFSGLTYVGLSMVKPTYTSEARILIQNGENNFTKSAFNQAGMPQNAIDNSAVGSQVQILTSNDLSQQVISSLNLKRLYQLESGTALSDEKVLYKFLKNVSVSHIPNTHVIGIRASSHKPDLSAKLANQLSDQYISWQNEAKLSQTIGATSWLKEQIETLRATVSVGESKLQKYRAKHGILTGENNITLDTQQLTTVNRELLVAKTRSAEAASRVEAMAQIMKSKGNVSSTTDVLRSGFIQRLLERRVAIEGRMSELSSSLLPSHPRYKRLSSELRSIKSQIAVEMKKVIASLKNESKIAQTREKKLAHRLAILKQRGGRNSQMQAKLKEMQRDVQANRTTLVGYMNRYQDVSGRRDNRALPTKATIISRAQISTRPSFPNSIMAYAIMAAFASGLLAVLYYGTQAIMSISTQNGVRRDYQAGLEAQAYQNQQQARQTFGNQDAQTAPQMAKTAKTAQSETPFSKVLNTFGPTTAAPRH